MASPSPFEIGRNIGNNFGASFARVKDENAIEQILSQAVSTGDPAVLQQSIGKILSQVSPERQGAALKYLENAYSNVQKKQEQTRLEEQERTAATAGGYTPFAPQGVQVQQVKNMQPQTPSGGLTGQPIPPNVIKALDEVVTNNPQASADDLALEFDRKGIPPIYTTRYVENRRRQDETKASNQRDDKKHTREEELQFHKEGQKYDEELATKTKIAKTQIETFKNIEKSIDSGNVKPFSMANILKSMGPIGELMGNAILNKDQATLLASIPALLEGWKDVFGVRLTDADLRILQDKLPSIGKNPEANRAIINVMKKYSDLTLLRSQIASDIKKKNNGLRPLNYADEIEKRYDEMSAPVKIINPRTGRTIEIPAYKVSDAIASGARLAPPEGVEQNEL